MPRRKRLTPDEREENPRSRDDQMTGETTRESNHLHGAEFSFGTRVNLVVDLTSSFLRLSVLATPKELEEGNGLKWAKCLPNRAVIPRFATPY